MFNKSLFSASLLLVIFSAGQFAAADSTLKYECKGKQLFLTPPGSTQILVAECQGGTVCKTTSTFTGCVLSTSGSDSSNQGGSTPASDVSATPTATPTPTPTPSTAGVDMPSTSGVDTPAEGSTSGSSFMSRDTFDKVFQALKISSVTADEVFKNTVVNGAGYGKISSPVEWAAFMANVMHESGNFQYKKELQCQKDMQSCISAYEGSANGPVYFGRGYMQLSHKYNYAAFSKDLLNDESQLVNNPDRVSDTDLAWTSALWFWKTSVKSHLTDFTDFGATVKLINGGLECNGQNVAETQDRFTIFSSIMKIVSPDTKLTSTCPGVQV